MVAFDDAEGKLAEEYCPHCRNQRQIVCAKFRFNCVAMVWVCPNCAMASAEEWGGSKWNSLAMEAHKFRVRYVLLFIVAAVVTAAVLRHGIHVYGGIPPEDIRTAAVAGVLGFTVLSALAGLIAEMRRRR